MMLDDNKIIIRIATEGDLPDMLKLYSYLEFDNNNTLELSEAIKIFKKISSYPMYWIYLFLYEDKIISTFALLIMDNLAHRGARSGIIEDIVVETSWRRKGIGKKMIQFAVEKCREYKCYKLTVSSNKKRYEAHKFFKSSGFDQHGYSFSMQL